MAILPDDRSGADARHHRSRKQSKESDPMLRLGDRGDQDGAERIKRAPADAEDETDGHQAEPGCRDRGKSQRGGGKKEPGNRHRPRRADGIGDMAGEDHQNDGADGRGRDDQAGKRLVAAALSDQHRDQKGHAIGDRKKKPADAQNGKFAAINLRSHRYIAHVSTPLACEMSRQWRSRLHYANKPFLLFL